MKKEMKPILKIFRWYEIREIVSKEVSSLESNRMCVYPGGTDITSGRAQLQTFKDSIENTNRQFVLCKATETTRIQPLKEPTKNKKLKKQTGKRKRLDKDQKRRL